MKCDVCGKEGEVFVASSAYGAVSFAYCDDCLLIGREPYWAIVSYIACAGRFPEDINEEYQKDVRRQLELHSINEEQFIQDIEKEIRYEQIMR